MRGRPRKFNEQEALNGAMSVFWEKGLSATSLDDLAESMKMNRPSIYNAFGNKEDIYRKALAYFCQHLDQALETTLVASKSVHDDFNAFFEQAIGVYCGTEPSMGCMAMCTAPSEVLSYPEIKADLEQLIERIDAGFEKRLVQAKTEEKTLDNLQPELAAKLLQATLQTLGLRARAGALAQELKAIADYAVKTIIV